MRFTLLIILTLVSYTKLFADSCSPFYLEDNLLLEFYDCKNDEKLNYQKKYSLLKDWNEDVVCRLCLEKIEANKASKKNLNDIKKSNIKKIQTEEIKPKGMSKKKINQNKNFNTKNLIEEKTIQNFENLESNDLSKRHLYCTGQKKHANYKFDVKIYFEFLTGYLGQMTEFVITEKSDWIGKGWISYGFDPALNEANFFYETYGINDGISTEKIGIYLLGPESVLYLPCETSYEVINGKLSCSKNKIKNSGGIFGDIVIDRTTLKLDESIANKALNFLLPGLGSLLQGDYSNVKCERSFDVNNKKNKLIIPYQKLKSEYDLYLESKKGKNKI